MKAGPITGTASFSVLFLSLTVRAESKSGSLLARLAFDSGYSRVSEVARYEKETCTRNFSCVRIH